MIVRSWLPRCGVYLRPASLPNKRCIPRAIDIYSLSAHRFQSTQAPAALVKDEKSKSSTSTLDEVKRLFQLAKPERKRLSIGIGLLFVSAGVTLSVPLTLGKVLDLFTNPEQSTLPVSLPTAAGLLLLVFACGAVANTGRVIIMRISGQRIVQDVRKQAFANVLRQDATWFDMQGYKPPSDNTQALAAQETAGLSSEEIAERRKEIEATSQKQVEEAQQTRQELKTSATAATDEGRGVKSSGDIISRLGSDASIVGDSITKELSEGLLAVFTTLVGVSLMMWISVKLTAVVIFIVPPTALGAVYYGRYVRKLSQRTQRAVASSISLAEEKLGAIKTIHAFNGVPLETRNYKDRIEKVFELYRKEAFATGFFFGSMGLTGNITLIALLSYGGSLVSKGILTVGQLSSLLLYTVYVGRSLVSLSSFYSSVMRGLGASGRLFELLDAQPKSVVIGQGRRLQASEPVKPIVFDRVSFAYPTRPDQLVLKDFSLTIQPGTSIAISGESGSGKSTITALLLRYYDPAAGGKVMYGEEPLKDLSPESWRERVAVVDQEPILFQMSISENIAYAYPEATYTEIREAAKAANCLEFIQRMPQGFQTQVGARGRTLSGGQRQRIAIARALLKKPKILILDEATSALDSAAEALVNEAIVNVTQQHGLTTILVAHRLSTLKTADKIVLLENGRLSEEGSFEELSMEGTRFSAMVRTQLLRSKPAPRPREGAESAE